MHHHDHDGDDDIEHTHDGDQSTGDLGQPVRPAQHTDGKQDGQDQTNDKRRVVAIEGEAGKGRLEIVGACVGHIDLLGRLRERQALDLHLPGSRPARSRSSSWTGAFRTRTFQRRPSAARC